MKDLIVYLLGLPLKIYLFGHIYLFMVNKLNPALQKHYSIAKRDVEALENTSTSWNRISAILQIYYFTLKSLIPPALSSIYISILTSEFLHRNFPAIMRHIYKWKTAGIKGNTSLLVQDSDNSIWDKNKSKYGDDNSDWNRNKSKWDNDNSGWDIEKSRWGDDNSGWDRKNSTWENKYSK